MIQRVNKNFLLANLLFVIIFGFFVYKIHLSKEFNQWDFRTYYYAVKVYEKGKDPYNLENLKNESNSKVNLKFIYPIYTLLFFKIFTFFEYDLAFDIYLFLKYFLIIFLFFLWSFYFLKKQNTIFFLIFSILAFKNTIFADLATGNISIFEQFFLWIAFYFYLEKKYKHFIFFVILASLFKVVLLFFLIMILFSEEKNKIFYFISGLSIFIFILLFSFLKELELFKNYFESVINLDERGAINPSSLPLIKDIFEILAKKIKNEKIIFISFLIYLIYVLFISFLSLKYINKIKYLKMEEWEQNRFLLFFIICFYVVISPRFKDYSYILILLPSFFIILKNNINVEKFVLFFLFIIGEKMFSPDIDKIYSKVLWAYYCFWLAVVCFILYFFNIKKQIEKRE